MVPGSDDIYSSSKVKQLFTTIHPSKLLLHRCSNLSKLLMRICSNLNKLLMHRCSNLRKLLMRRCSNLNKLLMRRCSNLSKLLMHRCSNLSKLFPQNLYRRKTSTVGLVYRHATCFQFPIQHAVRFMHTLHYLGDM